jgi:hypothetical protein
MPEIQITFYRHRTRPDEFAASPDPNGVVFPNPNEWEVFRQQIINTDAVLPRSEVATWLETFERHGYCLLRRGVRASVKSKVFPILAHQDNVGKTI